LEVRDFVVRVSVWMFLGALTVATAASSQEMTHLGTVVTVEPARIQVRLLDDTAKPGEIKWFAVDKTTRVKRGDQLVVYADAKITKGERIAVLMDTSAKTPMLASELRLAPVGQRPTAAPDPHAAHQIAGQKPVDMPMPSAGWALMQDGVVYGLFNQQGGPRGGREFVVPNWWMGMWSKEAGRHHIGFNAMFSLDPATVGKDGYREIFQVGEALDGKPLIDRQHPHDFIMQLAGVWRVKVNDKAAVTFAGGPAGEPTLGPVAFMHRASASGLMIAPLGHHTFDSTHISYGVVAAGIEFGPVTVEASVFNGREPDQDRWDFDFGRLDSEAIRVWYRPNDTWEAQVSTGWLREPEELTPGDARRTTASVSWLQTRDSDLKAVTFGYGVNDAHGERRHGLFGEFSIEKGRNSVSSRLEFQQVETEELLTGEIPDADEHAADPATVAAVTVSATRRLFIWRGFDGAAGAQVSFYGVPEILKPTHGNRPVSFQVFFRLRLPSGPMGRMWNMRMSQVHRMGSNHSGHNMNGGF
jgi:hypothetical protein